MDSAESSFVALPEGVIVLVPMRNVVLFPQVLMPLAVGRAKSIAAMAQARAGATLGIVLQKDAQVDDPGRDALCDFGTVARIVQYAATGGKLHHAVCQGMQRFRLESLVEGYPFLAARVRMIAEPQAGSTQAEAMALQLRERAAEILSLLPSVPAELAHALQATRSPGQLGDFVASLLDAEVAEKQMLLATLDIEERMARVLQILARRIEVLRLSQEIGERTRAQLDDRQRKVLLREQLKTIQRELGEDDGPDEDVKRLAGQIERAGMPDEVQAHARKELARLQRMAEASGEHAMLRSYLDWMTELPWGEPPEQAVDLEAARRILAEDHHGLEQAKRRIVEFLAVRKLNRQGRSPILCFVGPPGVGKRSLGQSVARALARPFVRVPIGGVHDGAEIHGHRRTYIGALPGNIIQGLRRAGTRHCVMLLDEVDKLSASAHDDPSAALLEALDPEQNSAFRDHYLGVGFDLSRVVFIATANVFEQLGAPLRERMEPIELPGYTCEDKLQIAQRYLVARQRAACGLREDQCTLSEDALRALVTDYTREAGVHQLEREIARVMRHAAIEVADAPQSQVHVACDDLAAILGPARFGNDAALRSSLAGAATGLAWTPAGGDIQFIEATRVPGSGRVILAGQPGDVIKESAQAALTLVKSRAAALRIPAAMFEGIDLHLHVPAGAIAKDGPSAGVAMFMALASLFSQRPVRHDAAMSGEVSLRGLVLPVGGVREKVLAAQRAGITSVLLPARNRKDLHDLPEPTRAAMNLVWLDSVDDAVRAALGDTPAQAARFESA